MLAMMSDPTPSSTPDPLLVAEAGPRDVRGRPVRTPLGNSGRTLIAFVVVLAVGLAVWWWRRPSDLTTSLGARTWILVEIDGEPVTTPDGTAPTFTLDGTGEVRAMLDCNTVIGDWVYASSSQRIEFTWATQTLTGCDESWTETYLPDSGEVDLDSGVLRIDGDAVDVVAVSPADHDDIEVDEIDGTWWFAGQEVLIGQRGLVELGTCRGSWNVVDDGGADPDESGDDELRIDIVFDELQRDDCDLADVWLDETSIAPLMHDGSLFLRRDRTVFPVDRQVIRLDPVE